MIETIAAIILLCVVSAVLIAGWYHSINEPKWRALSNLWPHVEWAGPEGFDPNRLDRALAFAVGSLSTVYGHETIRAFMARGGLRIHVVSILNSKSNAVIDGRTVKVGPSLIGVGEGLAAQMWAWSGESKPNAKRHHQALAQFERFWRKVGYK